MWPCIPVTNVIFTAHSLLDSYIMLIDITPACVLYESIYPGVSLFWDRVRLDRQSRCETFHSGRLWRAKPCTYAWGEGGAEADWGPGWVWEWGWVGGVSEWWFNAVSATEDIFTART